MSDQPGPEPTDAGVRGDASVVVRTHRLAVDLGETRILTDISLTVRAGEVVALLGANGSGKSTLVRALLGVIPHSSGSVTLFEDPLGRATPWSRIGYVPQRRPTTGGIPTTALEVVRSGMLSPQRLRLGSAARALAALDRIGMADRARQPVQELSGGQQQRVLIARALGRNPDLLVLDEPTTGVDVETTAAFVTAIEAMRRGGTTVIVVLHETEAFSPVLDRAVILRRGEITHDGEVPAISPGGRRHELLPPHAATALHPAGVPTGAPAP
ncbi:MAG: metal ABC transporter ATP-binding protein [Propioniciclava sp.]